jgi:hypothetical protein
MMCCENHHHVDLLRLRPKRVGPALTSSDAGNPDTCSNTEEEKEDEEDREVSFLCSGCKQKKETKVLKDARGVIVSH